MGEERNFFTKGEKGIRVVRALRVLRVLPTGTHHAKRQSTGTVQTFRLVVCNDVVVGTR